MREIVIISGKGGTGKSSVCSALGNLISTDVVVADCDVDAADLHLIFNPTVVESEDFFSGAKAEIDASRCVGCGLCAAKCRFEAINRIPASHAYTVDLLDCEGCGYCSQICPVGAISMPIQMVGQCYTSDSKYGCTLVHARLGIGADNSGKLVAKVKKTAKIKAEAQHKDFVLVDGSPGIGCPVISSLSGADLALLVTEPSKSGLQDLKRVWELVQRFQIPAACIVNKHDINPEVTGEIHAFLAEHDIRHLIDLPYDEDFPKAISMGKSLIEYDDSKWRPVFEEIWNRVLG